MVAPDGSTEGGNFYDSARIIPGRDAGMCITGSWSSEWSKPNEDGVLRPAENLGLRPGERVSLIVVRRPDPGRWDMTRLAKNGADEVALAQQGIAEWADNLDAAEKN